MNSAAQAILKFLQDNKRLGITSREAYDFFGVTRLSAVIHDLRKKHDIETVMVPGKTRFGNHTNYARYFYRGELNGNESTSNKVQTENMG